MPGRDGSEVLDRSLVRNFAARGLRLREVRDLLGHPAYYPRFGFTPASRFGLRYEHTVPDEAFMALELVVGGLRGSAGVVRYLPAFAART